MACTVSLGILLVLILYQGNPGNPESVTPNSTTEAFRKANETQPPQNRTSLQMTVQANDEIGGNTDNPKSVTPHSLTKAFTMASETPPPQNHTSLQTTVQANDEIEGNPGNPESVTPHSTTEAFTMASQTQPPQNRTSLQTTVQANDEIEDNPDNPESVTSLTLTETFTMESETPPPQNRTSLQTTVQATDEIKDNPDNPKSGTPNSSTEVFTVATETSPPLHRTSLQTTVQANDEIEGKPDNQESVKPHSTTETFTMVSETQPPQNHTLLQTTIQAKDEIEDGNDVVTTTLSADEDAYDEYGDYGNYEDYENAEAGEEVECKSPENGRLSKFFSNTYKFTCNDGYTLRSNGGEIYYKCSDGKLKSKTYGKEPKCTEKSCTLTREVLWEMIVFKRIRQKKRFYSEDFKFDAGEYLFFDCKDAKMEPTSRRFQCIQGIWTAAERDPNWKMTINDTDPSCRQAVCKQMCEFGGTCIRDGKCACSPGSTGEFCQTPMCQKACSENGGTCVAPNKCKCEQPRYGINCEKEYCTLTRKVLSEMNVFSRIRQEKRFYSEDFKVDAGKYLFFDCKDANMEPTSRRFQCIKGIWTAAEPDPNWKMAINDTDPSCRQAVCKQMCQFGGTCIRDGKCACSPGSTGEFCQTPICQGTCSENGGTCFAPNKCKCDQPRYGINCEKVGCTLPDVQKTVVINETMTATFFEIGATLSRDAMSCPTNYSISTDSNLTCNGNNSWSGKAHCMKVARYILTLQLGNHSYAGSSDDLYFTFFGIHGLTDSKKLEREMRNKDTLYTYDIYAIYVGQIQKMSIKFSGTDGVQFKYIGLDVNIDDAEERYMFSDVGWVDGNISPDPGCVAPTGEFQLRTQKGKYLTNEEIKMNEVQCQNGVPKTAITCLKDGLWSATPCEAGTRTYRIEINVKVHGGTENKVEVVLHGKDGSSDKVTFADHGLSQGRTTSRNFTLPNIGEVTRIRLTLPGERTDSMNISYIHLTTLETNDEYLFVHSGEIFGNTNITAQKLFKPGCAGTSFTQVYRGYRTAHLREPMHDLESCKEHCRKDNDCKAIEKSGFGNLYICYIVKTNDLEKFVFNDDQQKFKVLFRKC